MSLFRCVADMPSFSRIEVDRFVVAAIEINQPHQLLQARALPSFAARGHGRTADSEDQQQRGGQQVLHQGRLRTDCVAEFRLEPIQRLADIAAVCRIGIQCDGARTTKPFGKAALGRQAGRQPLRHDCHHGPVDIVAEAETMLVSFGNDDGGGAGDIAPASRDQRLGLAGSQVQNLKQGVMPMGLDLPVVQAASAGDRLGMPPELEISPTCSP